MINEATLAHFDITSGALLALPRNGKKVAFAPVHLTRYAAADEASVRSAELFYMQKQIQSQTPMVVVLEDGEQVEGVIEWYDRNCLKVRGRTKVLVYKSAIRYMYKKGDMDL